MSSKLDKCAAAACAELAARFTRVRAGVDAGFGDAAVSQALRAACPGVWMTVEDGPAARARVAESLDPKTVLQLGVGGEMPFDDHQFEVVVLSAALLSGDRERTDAVVRETHRILQGRSFTFTLRRRKTVRCFLPRRKQGLPVRSRLIRRSMIP